MINYLLKTKKSLQSLILVAITFTGCASNLNDQKSTPIVKNTIDQVRPTQTQTQTTNEQQHLLNDLKYQVKVTLPKCDINNKRVQIIQKLADWNQINNPDKDIFCVRPGDYSSLGAIKINLSGSDKNPKFIILDNNNNESPNKLLKSKLAKYRLHFNNAKYWIIDRLSYWEDNDIQNVVIDIYKSQNIVLNRILLRDTNHAILIRDESHNNVIQNSFFEKTQWSVNHSSYGDRAAINLLCKENGESIKNTKIVNNKIINYVDGVQLVRLGRIKNINFEGTLIANNLIYVTKIMYTDEKGKISLNGEFSLTENAIDLKGGSTNPDNPIRILNNEMWGFRASSSLSSDLGDPGAVIGLHYYVNNLVIKNNKLYDSTVGILSGVAYFDYALEDTVIDGNIIYDIKEAGLQIFGTRNKLGSACRNINIQNNFFGQCEVAVKVINAEDIVLKDNIFADSSKFKIAINNKDVKIIDNTFYNMNSIDFNGYADKADNIFKNELAPYAAFNLNFSSLSNLPLEEATVDDNNTILGPVTNVKISNIYENGITVTWDGSEKVKTWLYVYEPYNKFGSKHDVKGNKYVYDDLGPGLKFTLYVQGENEEEIIKKDFNTPVSTEFISVSNVRITSITTTGCTVSWEGNPNAQVWWDNPNGNTGEKHNASNLKYKFTDLEENTEYSIFVQGEKETKVIKKVFRTAKKYPPVSNIHIGDITQNSCTITWKGNPSAQVWWDNPKGRTGIKDNAKNNNYTFNGLTEDTEYYVFLQGIDEEKIIKTVIRTMKKYLPVTNVKISNVSKVGVTVKWDGNPNVQVWWYNPTGKTGVKEDGTEHKHTFTDLKEGTSYSIFVQGKADAHPIEVKFTTDKTIPPVTNVKVSNIAKNAVTVKWEGNSDVQVWWDNPSGKTGSKVSSTGYKHVFTDLEEGTTYSIFVQGAADAHPIEVKFTTDKTILPVSNVKVSAITKEGVTVKWEGNPNVQIWWDNPSGKTGVKEDATGNRHVFTGLKEGTNYSIFVQEKADANPIKLKFTTL